jgi:hypothetical protein
MQPTYLRTNKELFFDGDATFTCYRGQLPSTNLESRRGIDPSKHDESHPTKFFDFLSRGGQRVFSDSESVILFARSLFVFSN